MAIKSGFTAEDLAKMGPDALTKKKLLAEALLAKSAGIRDIKHPLQGVAQMADALFAGLRMRKLDQAEKIGQEGADKAWGNIQHLLGGGSSGSSTPTTMPAGEAEAELTATTPTTGTGGNYRDAIASIESKGSGNYSAIGPTHDTLGRALGRYQVMEANIPQWSKDALGREITADEFLANPELQDAIFDKRFGDYVKKYGPEGAAQAWFGGEGGVGQLDRKDSLGTSIADYTDKFRNAMGGNAGQQEVASIDPNASLSQEVADFQQTPEYAGQFPGMDAQQFDQRFGGAPQNIPQNQQQLAQALLAGQQQSGMDQGQQAIGGQMDDPRQQQVAQALIGQQQQQGVDPALMEALGNQYLDPQRRAIAQMLLEQQMQQRDPLRQMQLQKAQMELERMRNPQPEPTDDIREYKFAIDQGYKGTFQQFMTDMKRAGATNINNMGNIPPGYELVEDKATGARRMQPIAGSPAALEMDEKVAQKGRRQEAKETGGNVVIQDIDRIFNAMDTANLPTTGGVGNLLSGVPGTAAFDIGKLTDTIKANATFDKLQAMREASPTGGALGAVSDTENKLLGSAIGSLEQSQSEEQFRDNLARVQNLYLDIIHGPGNGPERRPLRFENKLPAASDGGVPEGMDAEVWKYMTPEEKRLFQ